VMPAALPLAAASLRLRRPPGRPRKQPARHDPRHVGRASQGNSTQARIVVEARDAGALDRPASAPAVAPRLLGLKAAAAYLGVSDWFVRALLAEGVLTRVQLGKGRRLLFDRVDLDRLIVESRVR
jgi:excisionase family DNA binding protein